MTGCQKIAAAFKQAREQNRPAFVAYYPLGYPSLEQSLDNICILAKLGVDCFELGIPYSDPVADGPFLAQASQRALSQGMTPQLALDAVQILKERGVKQPMLLMGYWNTFFQMGETTLGRTVASAQADGLIIADIPLEESEDMRSQAAAAGLGWVSFVSPTTNPNRLDAICQSATAFVYVIAVRGVTGVRSGVEQDIVPLLTELRRHTAVPIMCGFGISSAAQVRALWPHADGYIVGSALVAAANRGAEELRTFVLALQQRG